MNPLAIYLSAVLATLVPSMKEARRASIADDIATVTLADERAFDDDESGQKTALLLVSIAHYETGRSWATYVDNGSCNDPTWREKHALWLKGGDCDGSRAWGMWQVHAPGDDPTIGKTYVANRQTGIRAALTIARESLRSGAGLCHYSGETFPHCRLASMRLDTARNWVVKFPYHPEVMLAGDAATGVE